MDESAAMRDAIELARQAEGCVEPNPMVGCVILRDGHVIAQGYHTRFGEAHAEVEALQSAGENARGATVVVTLEPCRHEGKTPPCVDALIEAKVARVVIGSPDPSPISGGGIERLRMAGIDVTENVCREQSDALIRPFVKRTLRGLPWVIAKWAATLDGAIATRTGQSQWISGDASRRIVHECRARVDAVLIGVGTAISDDPQLTARDVAARRIARRVVIDPHLRLPDDAKLLTTLDVAPLTLAISEGTHAEQADRCASLEQRGVEIVALPDHPDHEALLDATPLLRHLCEAHGATNVLVEGGAGTTGRLLAQGMIDELMVFIAPKLIGDGAGIPPLRLPDGIGNVGTIDQATALQLEHVERLDDDVLVRYVLQRR